MRVDLLAERSVDVLVACWVGMMGTRQVGKKVGEWVVSLVER